MEILPLKNVEKEYILKALKYFDGNKSQTAKALGITVKTLYNKLEEYKSFPEIFENINIPEKQEAQDITNTLQKNNKKLQLLIQEVEQDSDQIREIILLYKNNKKSSLVKKSQLRKFSPWNKILSNKRLVEKYNTLVVENDLIKENLITKFNIE